MTLLQSGLHGAVTPRFRNVPRSANSAGLEAVELAASVGLHLDRWQADVLEGALAEKRDGSWASTEVGLVVPRQNGKGSILEARELAGLFLFGEKLQTHTAHRFDTCMEHFRRVRDLIEGSADLSRHVKRISESSGQERIELMSGQRLNFKARSKGSGRGFSGDLVVLDEAYWLQDLGALLPTLSARPNPQIWYTSSAPLPRAESDVLRRVCVRGRAREITYFEWSSDADVDLDDRAAWAAANPALGIRVAEDFVQIERGSLDDEEFARERLGIWHEADVNEPLIAPRDWKACEHPTSGPDPGWMADPVTFAVDATPDRAWATISAAGACRDGGVALEVVEHRGGVRWVVDRLLELQARTTPKAILIDPRSAAGSLIRPLQQAGVDVTEVSNVDAAKAAGDFYDAVLAHDIAHRGQPELDAAVAGATKRVYGDAWLWDRRAGTVISPLVAATLARWGHLELPDPPPPESDFYLL